MGIISAAFWFPFGDGRGGRREKIRHFRVLEPLTCVALACGPLKSELNRPATPQTHAARPDHTGKLVLGKPSNCSCRLLPP